MIEGIGPWRFVTKHKEGYGAQVDLLLNRTDGFVTICEIKASDTEFVIDKAYAENLECKISLVENELKKKALITFITMKGLKKNSYSNRLVANTIILDDLFDD